MLGDCACVYYGHEWKRTKPRDTVGLVSIQYIYDYERDEKETMNTINYKLKRKMRKGVGNTVDTTDKNRTLYFIIVLLCCMVLLCTVCRNQNACVRVSLRTGVVSGRQAGKAKSPPKIVSFQCFSAIRRNFCRPSVTCILFVAKNDHLATIDRSFREYNSITTT